MGEEERTVSGRHVGEASMPPNETTKAFRRASVSARGVEESRSGISSHIVGDYYHAGVRLILDGLGGS